MANETLNEAVQRAQEAAQAAADAAEQARIAAEQAAMIALGQDAHLDAAGAAISVASGGAIVHPAFAPQPMGREGKPDG